MKKTEEMKNFPEHDNLSSLRMNNDTRHQMRSVLILKN